MIDSIISLIPYLIIGLVAFFGFGWLGFRIPARVFKPKFSAKSHDLEPLTFAENLPEPFANFLRQKYPEGISPERSIVAWGRGKITAQMRAFGKVWLPLSWTLYLKPGEAYLWRTKINWFTRTFLSGGDLFLNNRGFYKMGSETLESEYIDQSIFTMLWVYSLVYSPYSFANNSDLKWKTIDDHTVWVAVPGTDTTYNDFKLNFNPTTGLLEKIQTKRPASRDGERLEFYSEFEPGKGKLSPYPTIKNAWESIPYLEIETHGIQTGIGVDQEFEIGI